MKSLGLWAGPLAMIVLVGLLSAGEPGASLFSLVQEPPRYSTAAGLRPGGLLGLSAVGGCGAALVNRSVEHIASRWHWLGGMQLKGMPEGAHAAGLPPRCPP